MTTTITPATDTAMTVWQARNYDDTPAVFAAVFTSAAALIREHGYTAYPDYEGETGHSLTTAVETSARAIRPDAADAAGLAEEALTRLAGVMYATGQLARRTHIDDISDLPAMWERHLLSGPRPDAATVTGVLGTAAAMLTAIPGDGAR